MTIKKFISVMTICLLLILSLVYFFDTNPKIISFLTEPQFDIPGNGKLISYKHDVCIFELDKHRYIWFRNNGSIIHDLDCPNSKHKEK